MVRCTLLIALPLLLLGPAASGHAQAPATQTATAAGQTPALPGPGQSTIPFMPPETLHVGPPPAPDGPKVPDPYPASSTAPSAVRYLNNPNLLKFATAQVGMFAHHSPNIIFIGDSITQYFLTIGRDTWDADFTPRNALDFGISGDSTQHILWRLQNYPLSQLHPRVAVVMAGTNNWHNTADEIAAGVHAVVAQAQRTFPGIRVIVCSILPNARANALTSAANSRIAQFADGQSVFFVDLTPLMPPMGDSFKGLREDKLHPSAEGYAIWAKAILPLVDRLSASKP
jgi:lysophospholipase L1-like esterase